MVFDCCEGSSYPETQQKTAKFLAALWLIAEQSDLPHQAIHQKLKVPYKMALTLRLVDEVIRKQICQVPNWHTFRQPEARYNEDAEARKLCYATVAVPAMTAALFQNAGLQHPLAVKLLHGADGTANPFRVLEAEERQSLLKMNYRFSADYVSLGLGVDHGTDYACPEQQVLSHATVLEVVKDAYKPKSGIGQILKIPQIYTSVVLSTKPEFSRVDVPKCCALIDQLGKKGVLNGKLASAFNAITGVFPQGFGINTSKYLSIVLGLNPRKPHEPNVIPLSAKPTYPLPDKQQGAHKIENYYFSETRKQFTPSQNAQIEALVKQTDNNDPSWKASETFHEWRAIWQRQ